MVPTHDEEVAAKAKADAAAKVRVDAANAAAVTGRVVAPQPTQTPAQEKAAAAKKLAETEKAKATALAGKKGAAVAARFKDATGTIRGGTAGVVKLYGDGPFDGRADLVLADGRELALAYPEDETAQDLFPRFGPLAVDTPGVASPPTP